MDEKCKLLYKRKVPSGFGGDSLISVWKIYGERIRITASIGEYGDAYAQILTHGRMWKDIETLHRQTKVRELFKLAEKPCQCSIEVAAQQDEDEILRLVMLLLEP